jgi:hypothetical protein
MRALLETAPDSLDRLGDRRCSPVALVLLGKRIMMAEMWRARATAEAHTRSQVQLVVDYLRTIQAD